MVLVDGLRTPFVKAGGVFKGLNALELGCTVVTELMQRTALNPQEVDQLLFGQVIPSIEAPNIAREIVLGTALPRHIDAFSVSRACATSTQAVASAALAILQGDADIAICGGAESLSNPPITHSDRMIEALMEANRAKNPMSKAKAFLDLKPKDLLPKTPALTERSTGLSMGESAEKMAKGERYPPGAARRLGFALPSACCAGLGTGHLSTGGDAPMVATQLRRDDRT